MILHTFGVQVLDSLNELFASKSCSQKCSVLGLQSFVLLPNPAP